MLFGVKMKRILEEAMNNNLDNEFHQLSQSYSSNLPGKINEIESAFNQLTSTWNSANFIAFSSLIHKLNGSAGIYGFAEISKVAAKIELQLSHHDHDIPANSQVIIELNELIAGLKNNIPLSNESPTVLTVKKIDTSSVFILNSNDDYSFGKAWVNTLTKELAVFGYKLSVYDDINMLFSAFNESNPLAIIINLDFILNPFIVNINNASLKEALITCFKNNHTLFFSKSGEIDKRLDAVRMHGKGFFLLPFEISELSNELDSLKRLWEEKFKVIIVDDDKELLHYESTLLSNAGIDNKAISSYKEIEKVLHEFKPDLLIFDINMDGCNGVELAAIIRQQKMYEYLPIIYLSTEEDKNRQVQALNVGADDFITKGTDPNIIIEKIRIRASRYKKIQTLTGKNSLTGAFNFEYIIKEMERFIRIYKNTSHTLTIAILKIANLNMVSQSYGYHAVDQLLTSLYVFLTNQLDFSRIVGHAPNNSCIIVFPDTSKEEAEDELKKLQEKFNSLLHYVDGKAYMSSFNMTVATYQNEDSMKKFIDLTASKLK